MWKIPDKFTDQTDFPPAIDIAREQENYFVYEHIHRLKTDLTVPPNETVRMNYNHTY